MGAPHERADRVEDAAQDDDGHDADRAVGERDRRGGIVRHAVDEEHEHDRALHEAHPGRRERDGRHQRGRKRHEHRAADAEVADLRRGRGRGSRRRRGRPPGSRSATVRPMITGMLRSRQGRGAALVEALPEGRRSAPAGSASGDGRRSAVR